MSSSWLLWIRRELDLRWMLVALIGLVIGMTWFRFPLNLGLLVGVLFLLQRSQTRLALSACFAVGCLLAPEPVVSREALPGPVSGRFTVSHVYESGFRLEGPQGRLWAAKSLVSDQAVIGDEVEVSGSVQVEGKLTQRSKVTLAPTFRSRFNRWFIGAVRKLGGDESAFRLSATVLGGADAVGSELRQDLQATGTYALITASGLQVYSLAWLVGSLLGLAPIPRGLQLCLAFAVLVFYLAVTGWHTGAFRAVAMCGLAWLAPYVRREFDGLSALAVVSLLFLLVHREGVYETGFQFSSVATAGWFLQPQSLRRVGRNPFWFQGLWMWLVVAPLGAYLFGVFSFSGLVLGPLVYLTGPVLFISTIVGVCLGMLVPFLGQALLGGAGVLGSAVWDLVRSARNWPLSSLAVPSFSGYLLLAFYVVLLRLRKTGRRDYSAS